MSKKVAYEKGVPEEKDYNKAPNQIWKSKVLTFQEKGVWQRLCAYPDDGFVFKRENVARDCNMCPDTLDKVLNSLVEKGALKKSIHRDGKFITGLDIELIVRSDYENFRTRKIQVQKKTEPVKVRTRNFRYLKIPHT